jgi:hypothetical protein
MRNEDLTSVSFETTLETNTFSEVNENTIETNEENIQFENLEIIWAK